MIDVELKKAIGMFFRTYSSEFLLLCANKHLSYIFASQTKMINTKQTADSDTVSTNQVSSMQLVTDKKLEALNKA